MIIIVNVHHFLHMDCTQSECSSVCVLVFFSFHLTVFCTVNIREVKVKAQCEACRVFDVTHRLLERTSLV